MMENLHNKAQEYLNGTDLEDIFSSICLHSWVILPIALPMVCVAMYGLFSLIKTDHVVPVYVINLLISDVLQICAKPLAFSIPPSGLIYELMVFIYSSSLMASIGFIMCISGERYIMIAHPLWYRLHRTITKSLLCCLLVWLTALVITGGITLASAVFAAEVDKVALCLGVVHLLPYPFVLFFFMGTWRALSRSIAVSPHEQRRIIGTLALVLFIYTVFFLPYIALMLILQAFPNLLLGSSFPRLAVMTSTLLSLNPVVDPMLYVFMSNKDLLVLPCRRRRQRDRQEQPGQRECSPPLSTSVTSGEMHV